MSVYAEMLRLALESDEQPGGTTSELVTQALARRVNLDGGGDTASRLARALAYDVTLVRLCEQLGIDHDMTGPAAGPVARRHIERVLAVKLPEMGAGMRQA